MPKNGKISFLAPVMQHTTDFIYAAIFNCDI